MIAVHPYRAQAGASRGLGPGARRCVAKFLRFFPRGFRDPTYLDWERDYKVDAHERWGEVLGGARFRALMRVHKYEEVAAAAVRVESRVRHAMLFSFEKMALRDAVRSAQGAEVFARGLYDFLHGSGAQPAASSAGATRSRACRGGRRACSPGRW